MRMGGLRNERRGGQQATQQAAHQLPQESRMQLGETKEEEGHDDVLMNEDGVPADAGDGVPELAPEYVEVGVLADDEHDVLDPELEHQRQPG